MGGAREVQKTNSCKGKLRGKNTRTASSPENNVLAYGKNIPGREMLTKKIPAARIFPTSP